MRENGIEEQWHKHCPEINESPKQNQTLEESQLDELRVKQFSL